MYSSKKTYTVEEALAKLQSYCAYQDRCHKEVAQKLKEMRVISQASEQIIIELIEGDFLNEERFATLFAGGHFRIKQWGKSKIQYALQQKRVSPVNIKKALKSIDLDDYNTTLLYLAKKKWNSLKGERGLSRMAKTQAFLYQRGFESALIQPILQQLNKAK